MSEHDRERAEAGRVIAEDERVVAEQDRVDAEAGEGGAALELGRVQAEEGRVVAEDDRVAASHGRVEAEESRVAAEAKREHNHIRVYRRVATLVALPIALITVIPLAAGMYVVNEHAVNAERKARIIAADAAHVSQQKAYKAQLAACARGNVLRRRSNANNDVLLAFAVTASKVSAARAKQFRSVGNVAQAAINEKAATKYAEYAKALLTIPIVDCVAAIPQP